MSKKIPSPAILIADDCGFPAMTLHFIALFVGMILYGF